MTPPRVPFTVDRNTSPVLGISITADSTEWTADAVWIGRFTSAGGTRTSAAPAPDRQAIAPAPDRTSGAPA